MRAFRCGVCDNTLYFDNSVCLSCGSAVGYSRVEHRVRVLENGWSLCRNRDLNGCNWIPDVAGDYCFSCRLTRTRPSDDDVAGIEAYYEAEHAKRRLCFELDELDLPMTTREEDPERGLAFDLLSSTHEAVTTGHADGVITLDLAEGDDAHREQMRVHLDEPYRTMLGHFRHEIGHYFEMVLVEGSGWHPRVRDLFGDDSSSYQDALDRHYHQGAPADWRESYVSKYATMHPYEDFAETFAHVLHVRDTVQTAGEFGLTVAVDPSAMDFRTLVTAIWLPLSYALNQINRSMGEPDLYPFVLPPPVLDKLALVGEIVADQG